MTLQEALAELQAVFPTEHCTVEHRVYTGGSEFGAYVAASGARPMLHSHYRPSIDHALAAVFAQHDEHLAAPMLKVEQAAKALGMKLVPA